MSLEDETGFVNAVLYERVFARYATLARTAALLGVEGRLENRDGVAHIIATRLFAPRLGRLPAGTAPSRDFR
ncbi:MAG: hypothetical protein KatS3mg102_2703 [Planctomycetota bacterium]|nr:MAG: hypothetical protein KatS3mg102_2703 [Planctomycetota bacterium]